ncbi:hypothetical protein BD626DRAFT_207284 [Schizophyllum amplum]|uniref:Uncharacterized protein n=1 Tax=Schizophyllum amplum TaxID=97359 RepID=A0A550BYW1_9AGAR|nr:hypothetical protein BD626DRAFT_207284 [Auriculariopsis ampla]
MGDSWLLHTLSCLEVSASCGLRAKPARDEHFMNGGPSHLSFLPPPAQFHPLLHINCIQVKVITSKQEHLTCAVHSGSLFVTVGAHVTQVDWPEWTSLRKPYGHLVLIIAANLTTNEGVLPKILLQFPHLGSLRDRRPRRQH